MENKSLKKLRNENKFVNGNDGKVDISNTQNKNKKSPSKKIRDLRRLLMFKCRVKSNMKVSQSTQTDSIGTEEKKKVSKWTFWRKKLNDGKTKQFQNNTAASTTRMDREVEHHKPLQETTIDTQEKIQIEGGNKHQNENPESIKIEGGNKYQNVNPGSIYRDLDSALQLSYLEEPRTLTMALRHLVRYNHEKGKTITFPQIETVDRIVLKTKNLPTNPIDLLELVKRVFERRGEILNMEEVYAQCVKTHGRTTFDPRQNWPQCYVHTFSP